MRRTLILAAVLAAGVFVVPARAADLSIGDAAPKLEASNWVKGEPIDLAEAKGKNVVVLEFWATWCGPCVASVPHLTKLQKEYADKGVVIVGVTSEDPNNSLEQVQKFVQSQGDKLAYTIAFDKEGKSDKAFMEATGQSGIPTSFIIDKQGRIAWIGHPMDNMDDVLASVVAGTYDIALARKKYDLSAQINEAMFDGEPERAIEAADRFIALDEHDLSPWATKLQVLAMIQEKPDQAYEVARKAVEVFGQHPDELSVLSGMMASYAADDGQEEGETGALSKELRDKINELALTAVNRAAKLAPDDADVRSNQYSVLAALKRDDEALAVADQAIALMKDDAMSLARFALILSSPDPKNRCNDLALRAVELAIAIEPDEPGHLENKFRILAVCKNDTEGARKLGYYLVEKAADNAGLLNGFSWTLLTEEPLMGKFNELALLAAEKCHQVSGGTNWAFIDTLALAKFETGAVDEAIKLEEKAIELCDQGGLAKLSLEMALERFKEGKK